MSGVLAALAAHAAATPRAPALAGAAETLDYATLQVRVASLARRLESDGPRVLGLLAENGIDWALADLAALAAGIPLVPLPTFFSPAQRAHVLASAGIDRVLTDRPDALGAAAAGPSRPFHGSLESVPLHGTAVPLPPGTAKITFTSGTTGTPKGVCLGREAMERVAVSLREASGAGPADRHLALLPLATLLENIGGLYVPLLAGACTRLLPGEAVGLAGSSGVDAGRMAAALAAGGATTTILVPQLLLALVAALKAGAPRPAALRYAAVGGAPVSPRLLGAATVLGLPVFEGYGLSECASVVAVNRAGDNRPGSVGRVLPHAQVALAQDGSLRVRGAGFLGYLGEAPRDPDDWVDTGDLGRFAADGTLHLTGRRRNMFITAFGRNVAPEWVERELLLQPAIAQAAVFGEGRPFNAAVVVPRDGAGEEAIAAAVAFANRDLPDYARVSAWVRAAAPFSVDNGQLTANGRPRREPIAAAYADALDALYHKDLHGHLL